LPASAKDITIEAGNPEAQQRTGMASSDSENLSERLRAIRAKRGYLLPHHGLMAVAAPDLLQAYDETYTALTLTERVLSRHDHESVWLAILIATDEALATHHIPKFRDAGGSDEEFDCILSLTAFVLGYSAYRFIDRHWHTHLPGIDVAASYRSAFDAAAQGLDARIAQLCAIAIHTCKAAWDGLEWQLCDAYAQRVPETEIAEALSLTMFPGSVPYFVEAAAIWRKLIVADRVPASDAFRDWAQLSGQGGYDEASTGTAS
jgi:alkylhydroperoxidase/carboxymuconolactone decarboxylase family protein YurZ